MTFSHFHQMHGAIRVDIGCPGCGIRLQSGKMLEEYDDVHLSHYECDSCKHYSLALVYESHIGVSSVVVMTDLCFDDVVKARFGKPVTADDVLSLHQIMKFESPKTLFERPKKRVL